MTLQIIRDITAWVWLTYSEKLITYLPFVRVVHAKVLCVFKARKHHSTNFNHFLVLNMSWVKFLRSFQKQILVRIQWNETKINLRMSVSSYCVLHEAVQVQQRVDIIKLCYINDILLKHSFSLKYMQLWCCARQNRCCVQRISIVLVCEWIILVTRCLFNNDTFSSIPKLSWKDK